MEKIRFLCNVCIDMFLIRESIIRSSLILCVAIFKWISKYIWNNIVHCYTQMGISSLNHVRILVQAA